MCPGKCGLANVAWRSVCKRGHLHCVVALPTGRELAQFGEGRGVNLGVATATVLHAQGRRR